SLLPAPRWAAARSCSLLALLHARMAAPWSLIAKRLQSAIPELVIVAIVPLDVVGDRGGGGPSLTSAVRTKPLGCKLGCPPPLPCCCLVPAAPFLGVAAVVVLAALLPFGSLPKWAVTWWFEGHGRGRVRCA